MFFGKPKYSIKIGVTTMERNVPVIIPKTFTMAIPLYNSEPSPPIIKVGNIPKIVENEVIKIGLVLLDTAQSMASTLLPPEKSFWLVASTKKIPLLTTIPIRRILFNFAYLIIHQNPMKYIEPDFHNNLYNEVLDMCILQLEDLYNCNDPCIIDELCELIDEALKLCFTHIVPKRSYKNNIVSKPDIPIITKKLDYLKNVPQPEQRTNEWYEFRWKYLTASSIWKAFGTKGVRNQLIYSKCKPLDISKYTGRVNLDSPLHWGQKYEDVSIDNQNSLIEGTTDGQQQCECLPG